MIVAPRRISAVAAAWGLGFAAVATLSAQPPGSIPPVYSQRLQVPVRGDGLQQPRSVVADHHTGEIFVCDMQRNRIVIFDPEGRFRYEIPGGSSFISPLDVAVDPEGYLYVVGQASSDLVLLDFDGRLLRRVGLSGLPEGMPSPRFNSLAMTPDGERLYLLDFENDRLWITGPDGAVLDSVDLRAGRSQKEIDELRYGHVDLYGNRLLLPIPTDSLVHLFDLDGRPKGTIGAPGGGECQTMFPAAAALDADGRAIILDQQRALFMTWDVERNVCVSEHYGFGNAAGAFYQPSDMALDRAGRLYVSQGFEGRVQVYDGARPALTLAALESPPPAETEQETKGPPRPATPIEPNLEPAGAESSEAVTAEISQTLEAWAGAWSKQDVEAYLAFYSPGFDPSAESSRAEWERLRRVRLERLREIEVSLEEIRIRLTAPDRAEAAFVQIYRSNLYADTVDKILSLTREDSRWKIVAERVIRNHPR